MSQNAMQTAPRASHAGVFAGLSLLVVSLLYFFASQSPGTALHNAKLLIFKTAFIGILLEALPFILIGVLASALLQVFVSDRMVRRIIPRHPLLGILTAGLLGIVFPICECGMVPAIRGLIRKGMPAYVASTFILVGPILNPIVFWSTWVAFRSRPEMTYARMGLALAVAIAVGLIVYRFVKGGVLRDEGPPRERAHDHSHGHSHSHGHAHGYRQGGVRGKLTEMMSHSVGEFFEMGKFLLFGALLVGLLQAFVPQQQLASLGHGHAGSSLLMMGLGFALSLCSTSDAFVAQSFLATFSKGSLVAFMVFGPMLNLKSLLMMLAVFKTKFVALLAVLSFVFVYAGAWVLETWLLKGG
ncbi:permease [Cohnella sp. REN36]|uniref:permease n=1 Tax=Cohnella sp. REN36 TaxID=2887347 RepID=UPI001D141A89|nr:permease [Cohnella sp. REN36]MCC3375439.1 permease [Cohnella sp. REN36]